MTGRHDAGAGFDARDFLRTLTHKPGVYRMLGGGKILYVGKAKDLNKRVATYFGRRWSGSDGAGHAKAQRR